MRVLSLVIVLLCSLSAFLPSISAQDPAEGWMAYAVGAIPSNYQRITSMEMYWKVGATATTSSSSSAFYSPWFGMDPSDNLNLIQPVNPWGGSSWSMYTEYYQWSDGYNSNSDSYSVSSGQTLHGTLEYISSSDSYLLTQTIVETGQSSSQTVQCQNGKKYTVPYIVYEKVWSCDAYPPDQQVVFYNITIQCDGTDCTKATQWTAAVKDSNCDMTAHVDQYPEQLSITWSTTAQSKFSNYTTKELVARNSKNGWAKQLLKNNRRPKTATA